MNNTMETYILEGPALAYKDFDKKLKDLVNLANVASACHVVKYIQATFEQYSHSDKRIVAVNSNFNSQNLICKN